MSVTAKTFLKITHQLFYILFFVTPLVLWPMTSEVFEFNKMMFVYLMTILITGTWVVESIYNRKVEIAKTPLDIPILLFLASQVISTVTSIDPHTSLWGYYSRFHGGLMSTISYVALYYALVTHFRHETRAIRNLVSAILSSAALISIYAVLEHFGIDKNIWIQDVQNRVFSTLGQPNWLSAFLVALLPFSLYKIINEKSLRQRLLYSSLSFLYLIAIAFTKSQSGIAATALTLLLFFIITAVQKKKSWLILALIPLAIIAVIVKGNAIRQTLSSLNKINPFYSNTLAIITEENKTRIGGSDSMTIRRVVWEGAIKLGLRHPFFGTGVETFAYSYYWVRPATHNLISESDFLYNKAHNEYLNFFATCGFVGLSAYLFLVGSILYLFVHRQKDTSDLRLPLLLGFVSILITNYFGFSVVNIALFFFLYPAIFIATLEKELSLSRKLNVGNTFGIIIVSLLAIYLISGLSRAWRADIAYRNGRSNLEEAEKAIKLNPTEPIYYAQLAGIDALLAAKYIAPEIAKIPATASAQTKQQAVAILDKYVQASLDNINKAQKANPYNLNILKSKARLQLESLATLDQKYYTEALSTLLHIIELSPSENSNYDNVGILYLSLGKNDLAKIAFQRAIELDPLDQVAKDYLQKIKP